MVLVTCWQQRFAPGWSATILDHSIDARLRVWLVFSRHNRWLLFWMPARRWWETSIVRYSSKDLIRFVWTTHHTTESIGLHGRHILVPTTGDLSRDLHCPMIAVRRSVERFNPLVCLMRCSYIQYAKEWCSFITPPARVGPLLISG